MTTHVPEIVGEVRQKILDGCTFVDLLSFVRAGKELPSTPFPLIRILVQTGMSRHDVQRLYPFFDENLRPLCPEEREAGWRTVVRFSPDRLLSRSAVNGSDGA